MDVPGALHPLFVLLLRADNSLCCAVACSLPRGDVCSSSVTLYAVLMSHAMLFPVLWTLLEDNCARTAASVHLCSFLSPPPHHCKHTHGVLSTVSASTVQAATVGGKIPTSSTEGRRRGAHPQHRRGEETGAPKAQTGERDAPNGGADGCRSGASVDGIGVAASATRRCRVFDKERGQAYYSPWERRTV